MSDPSRRTVMIREVDVETWVFLRGEAARRRWTTAAVLEHVVSEWRAGRGGVHGGASGGNPPAGTPDADSDRRAAIAV